MISASCGPGLPSFRPESRNTCAELSAPGLTPAEGEQGKERAPRVRGTLLALQEGRGTPSESGRPRRRERFGSPVTLRAERDQLRFSIEAAAQRATERRKLGTGRRRASRSDRRISARHSSMSNRLDGSPSNTQQAHRDVRWRAHGLHEPRHSTADGAGPRWSSPALPRTWRTRAGRAAPGPTACTLSRTPRRVAPSARTMAGFRAIGVIARCASQRGLPSLLFSASRSCLAFCSASVWWASA
jgi:hypothetical protein